MTKQMICSDAGIWEWIPTNLNDGSSLLPAVGGVQVIGSGTGIAAWVPGQAAIRKPSRRATNRNPSPTWGLGKSIAFVSWGAHCFPGGGVPNERPSEQ